MNLRIQCPVCKREVAVTSKGAHDLASLQGSVSMSRFRAKGDVDSACQLPGQQILMTVAVSAALPLLPGVAEA